MKKTSKKTTKEIPFKNYIMLVLMAVIVVILTLYINAWVKTYKEKKISESPFSGIIEEVNIEDINLSLSESNEIILYVGYTNDQKIYNMEEKLLTYIKEHDLVDKFMYLNITDDLENNKYIDSLKDIFSSISKDIKKAPMLIYIKNGEAVKVINAKNGIIHTYDILNLNETFELE